MSKLKPERREERGGELLKFSRNPIITFSIILFFPLKIFAWLVTLDILGQRTDPNNTQTRSIIQYQPNYYGPENIIH